MVIDIIDLTASEFQNLNSVQLSMVRAAQSEKNKLTAAAELEKGELFRLLLSNGVVRSTALEQRYQEIDAECERQVDILREDLRYQLSYEMYFSGGNDDGLYRYPQNPNYNLTYSQRFIVVRSYYMKLESNAYARLEAFGMDTLARSYLGEYYQTLYDLLASYC